MLNVELQEKRKRGGEARKKREMPGTTLSRVLHEGASDFLLRDEFDITARMQKRVTEIDGCASPRERVVFLMDTRQILIPSSCHPPAMFPLLLSRIRAKERLPFDSPLINFASRRTRKAVFCPTLRHPQPLSPRVDVTG